MCFFTANRIGCTPSARTVSRAKFSQKTCHGGRKFTTFVGNFVLRFPKKLSFLFFFLLPSQCTTRQMQHGRSRTVGGSIPARSVPTPCELLPPLAQLLRYYCLCALSRTSARRPACCTRLLPHTLCLLP